MWCWFCTLWMPFICKNLNENTYGVYNNHISKLNWANICITNKFQFIVASQSIAHKQAITSFVLLWWDQYYCATKVAQFLRILPPNNFPFFVFACACVQTCVHGSFFLSIFKGDFYKKKTKRGWTSSEVKNHGVYMVNYLFCIFSDYFYFHLKISRINLLKILRAFREKNIKLVIRLFEFHHQYHCALIKFCD